jgi:hypothetical protein
VHLADGGHDELRLLGLVHVTAPARDDELAIGGERREPFLTLLPIRLEQGRGPENGFSWVTTKGGSPSAPVRPAGFSSARALQKNTDMNKIHKWIG